MGKCTWRFPENGYGSESGLDTSDMETFKKDPVASLAREICQNSIDAAAGEEAVRVEFSLYKAKREDIPGIERLAEEINRCYDYRKDSPKEGEALKNLKRFVEKKEITCMRISDFNTTGIDGVDTNLNGTNFYNLTRGSGVSDKIGSSGGSKGIGKFASFVASALNTVFYATKTLDANGDEIDGYLGITHLRSVPLDEPGLMTTGIGFFGEGKRNQPILKKISIGDSFRRQSGELGTDVYLVGFDEGDEESGKWRYETIAKVLESFMVAIVRSRLEVVVQGIHINAGTIEKLLDDPGLKKATTPGELRELRAQYTLLSGGEGVSITEVEVDDGETVTVYMKEYDQSSARQATKQCCMVRYPYMKITHFTTGAVLPFSALCVIEQGKLADDLRSIENPQHTDWEIKRLNGYPGEKRRVRGRLKALVGNVKDYILDSLRDSTGDSTDIIGAGDFLPSQDDYGTSIGEPVRTDKQNVSPVTVSPVRVAKTVKASDHGETLDFTTGDTDDAGEEGEPLSNKPGAGANPYVDPEPEDTGKKVGEGAKSVLKKTQLSGMKIRTIVTSRAENRYRCVFTSLYDESCCEMKLRMCGESNDKYDVNILEASIDGKPCEIVDGLIKGITLKKGEKVVIEYKVDEDELFASEVILNAYR